MLALVETLKIAMNTFTANVKEIYSRNQKNVNVYSNEYMSKKIAEEVTIERRKALDICAGLESSFKSDIKNAKTKLLQVKYPNSLNEATRSASELQLTHARELLGLKPDILTVIKELEMAYEIGRVDFVSSILSSIKAENLYPVDDSNLLAFEILFNEKYAIEKPQQEYIELVNNEKLLRAFINELIAGGEYTPYPINPNEFTDEQFFKDPELAKKSTYYLEIMSV